MESRLFRQKDPKRITSQEELHDYMRVTSPRLWMILGAIVLLLAGFIAYAATATLENTMKIRVGIQTFDTLPEARADGAPERLSIVSSQLPISLADTVDTGMRVRVGEHEGRVTYISEDADQGLLFLAIEMDDGFVPFPDGEYDADLILESTTPISFLWNG